MAPPKKYEKGSQVIFIRIDSDTFKEMEEVARKCGQTKTELITISIRTYLLEQKKEDPNNKLNFKEFDRLDFMYELKGRFRSFDSIKFKERGIAKDWAERWLSLLKKAKRMEIGDKMIAEIGLRMQFLYDVVIPDIYNELYTDKGILDWSLWYSFREFVENGCKRPPKPEGWGKDKKLLESIKIANELGLPVSGSEKEPALGKKKLQELEHKEEEPVVQDEVFDDLMDFAEKLEGDDDGKTQGN